MDFILTGASLGIGRALARALASPGRRLFLVARDRAALDEVASEVRTRGAEAVSVPADLSSVEGARAASAAIDCAGATLIHNAGIWPSRRELVGGFERAFVVNYLAPRALQEALLARSVLRRIMVVGAGAMAAGRVDPERTPRGDDFSALRTYCSTKLCFAVHMRDVAASHPSIEVVVVHPGVVRTDLGARGGALGWVLDRLKRRWEDPETCAARLARILARERWSPPGEARWLVLEEEKPWPRIADDPRTREAVRRLPRT